MNGDLDGAGKVVTRFLGSGSRPTDFALEADLSRRMMAAWLKPVLQWGTSISGFRGHI
jgi:hypothetical protein